MKWLRSALKASIKTIFKHFNPKAEIPFGDRVQALGMALSSEGRGVGFSPAHAAQTQGQSSMSLPSARPPCSPKPRLQASKATMTLQNRLAGKPTKDLLSAKCFCEAWKASELNEEHQVRASARTAVPPIPLQRLSLHSRARGAANFPMTLMGCLHAWL